MHNAHKVEEQSRELNEKIVEKAAAIMQLRTQLNSIGEENHQIQSECRQLKEEILRHRSNEEELSNRNTAVREKFSNVDINLKKEADKINDEMKAFFKKLGLKVKLCPTPADRFVELKIHFIEKRDCHVLFTYDPLTEDYDLAEIHPEHPRFQQLRKFLGETRDIQGFLTNYRNSILKS